MISIPVSRYVSASVLALTLAMPAALSPILASPAHAFGFGRVSSMTRPTIRKIF